MKTMSLDKSSSFHDSRKTSKHDVNYFVTLALFSSIGEKLFNHTNQAIDGGVCGGVSKFKL